MAASDPTFGVATPTGVLEGVAAFGWDGSAWQPSGRAAYGVGTPTGVLRGVAPFTWSGSAWTPAGQAGPGVATPSGVLQGVAVYTWNGSAWTPAGGAPGSATPTGVLRGVAAFAWDGAAWQPAGQAGPDVATSAGVLQGVAMFNWSGAAWAPSAGLPPGATLSLNFMTPGTLDPLLTFTRASTGTYFDSTGTMQTAAINAPRWDYDPVSLQLRGLLLEEQRTNANPRASDYTAYTLAGVVITPGGAIAPDGSAMSTVTENTLNQGHCFYNGNSFNTTAAVWTHSVFIKPGTQRYISLRGNGVDGVPNLPWITFDTQTHAINANAYVTSSGFASLPNGVFRIWLTAPQVATACNMVVAGSNVATAPGPTIGTGNPYIGSSQTWYVWGWQSEIGNFPTSYIPTTTVAVVRSIDTALYSTAPLDANTGSLLAEFYLPQIQGASANVEVASMDQGAVADIMSIRQMGAGAFGAATVFVANANVGSFTATALALGVNKVAMTYARGAPNAVTVAANGGAVTSGAPTGLPTPTRLTFGTGRNTVLGGHIRRVTYWPRVLSNTELRQVTT